MKKVMKEEEMIETKLTTYISRAVFAVWILKLVQDDSRN